MVSKITIEHIVRKRIVEATREQEISSEAYLEYAKGLERGYQELLASIVNGIKEEEFIKLCDDILFDFENTYADIDIENLENMPEEVRFKAGYQTAILEISLLV